MKILAVGGGSGGHVTPVVAVLRELKKRDTSAELRFWCDHSFRAQARSIMDHFDKNIAVETIVAGKFRRYSQWSILKQLSKPSLVLLNLRDLFFFGIGFMQSFVKLLLWRPDVVFTKGGYVCLPVGLAAHALRIPLVIHDSDAHPGLTNRVLGRFADVIATGAPLKFYHYPSQRSHYVGIPISDEFHVYDNTEKQHARDRFHLPRDRAVVVITGGGLGARRLNDVVIHNLKSLETIADVVLISGVGQYSELKQRIPSSATYVHLYAFISEGMADLLGAADVVVARAGATTILELAALAAPTILVPNAFLTGGHQVKNAQVYAEQQAAIVLTEKQLEERPSLLPETIQSLIDSPTEVRRMTKAFHQFAKPQASQEMADLILSQVRPR